MKINYTLSVLTFSALLFACKTPESNGEPIIGLNDTNNLTIEVLPDTQKSAEFGDDQFIIDKLSEKEKEEIMVTFKGEAPTSIKDYFQNLPEGMAQDSAAQFYDFDNDGKNELIIFIYSGGIAGLSYYIFNEVADNTYNQIYSYGGLGFDIQGNKLKLYPDGYRYFFTCGACSIELPNLNYDYYELEFRNGMFHWAKPDSNLNKKIVENLEWLKKRGPVAISSENAAQDDGERKAYGQQLLSYLFNNQRDLVKSETLFKQYYINSDKREFWSAFLDNIKSEEELISEWVK